MGETYSYLSRRQYSREFDVNNKSYNTGLASHAEETDHKIDFDGVSLLAYGNNESS